MGMSVVLSPAIPNNFENMSPNDLYLKLYRQSQGVDREVQAQDQKKVEEQKRGIDYHHRIQRIGPDPAPDDDLTFEHVPDPNPLHPPYAPGDKLQESKDSKIPPDGPDNVNGPPDDPADNPDRTRNIPTTPLTAPDNQSITTQNPMIQTDEQSHYLKDQKQPLKTPEERVTNPKTQEDHPLQDPVK